MTEHAPNTRRRLIGVVVIVVVAVAAVLLLLRACQDEQPQSVSIVAAGDMGCDPKDPGSGTALECQAKAVSDIAVGL